MRNTFFALPSLKHFTENKQMHHTLFSQIRLKNQQFLKSVWFKNKKYIASSMKRFHSLEFEAENARKWFHPEKQVFLPVLILLAFSSV